MLLKRHSILHKVGDFCSINTDCVFTDPDYVSLGNNVCLSSCALVGHDGSISVLNRAFDVRLESVGKIVIKDNVFVGFGAIIMPSVTIGPNSIVAAGAVVTRDVCEGDIVGGVPARPIGKVDELLARLKSDTAALPWGHLIAMRKGSYDAAMEPTLRAMRIAHFFPDDQDS